MLLSGSLLYVAIWEAEPSWGYAPIRLLTRQQPKQQSQMGEELLKTEAANLIS